MEELDEIGQERLAQQRFARDTARQLAQQRVAEQRRKEWTVLLSCLAVVLFFGVNFKLVKVQGHSMEPTYHNGQLIVIWRTAPLFAAYRPGDVIVFRHDGDEDLIKRIAFVQSPDGSRRMPRLLPTPAGLEPVNLLVGVEDHTDFPGYWEGIGAAEEGAILTKTIFVMGDNTWNSDDSRDFGPIDPAAVLGKAILPRPTPLDDAVGAGKGHLKVWQGLMDRIARA